MEFYTRRFLVEEIKLFHRIGILCNFIYINIRLQSRKYLRCGLSVNVYGNYSIDQFSLQK